MLGQFREKWHNCITGSNQDHYDDDVDDGNDEDFYDEDDANSNSVDKDQEVFKMKFFVNLTKFRGAK